MSIPVTQNILSCLDDIITLDGCSDIPSTSGFRMGDIGITKKELDSYINSEYESGFGLFEEKKRFCISLLANQVHSHMQGNYKTNTLLNSKRVGQILDNLQTQNISGNAWVGQEFNLRFFNSFLHCFISEVSIFANYTGNIEVRIYDLKTGKILKSESGNDLTFIVDAVAGEVSTVFPQIRIHAKKRELDIAILYNTSGIIPYRVAVKNEGSTCSSCAPTCHTKFSDINGILIPEGSSIVKSNVQKLAYTGGLSIVYSVNCDQNDWLCSISNLIALPLLYKIGSEIMDYALNNSDQINSKRFAEFNQEKIQKRKDEYEFKSREAFDNIIEKIVLPDDSLCFYCQEKIMFATTRP